LGASWPTPAPTPDTYAHTIGPASSVPLFTWESHLQILNKLVHTWVVLEDLLAPTVKPQMSIVLGDVSNKRVYLLFDILADLDVTKQQQINDELHDSLNTLIVRIFRWGDWP
jgi:hypothetical protein